MAIKMRRIGPCFAAEVEGIDLLKPLSEKDAAVIHAGMDEHAVLVFHDQPIDDAQQVRFSRYFGPVTPAHPASPDQDQNVNVIDQRCTRSRSFACGTLAESSESLSL